MMPNDLGFCQFKTTDTEGVITCNVCNKEMFSKNGIKTNRRCRPNNLLPLGEDINMYKLCKYDYTETPGVLICINCQRTKTSARAPAEAGARKCTDNAVTRENSLPPITTQAKNFIKAQVNHLRNGSPQCTQEQINERLAICQNCPFFNGNKCTKCGCNCNNNPNSWKNKLAMADATCPLNPPKWREIPIDGV